MELTIQITGADGRVKARACGAAQAVLAYNAAYEEGDRIMLYPSRPGFIVAQLEDSIPPVYGYLAGEYHLPVPFGEKRVSYSPKSFTGGVHLLWARPATALETGAYRNLALNPLDNHYNTVFFPHAQANVETRGESVFAARNAIDGHHANTGHGPWPYQSWGINRQSDAEIRISFGRPVSIDQIVITLRADFPHDNWWKQATLRFSDGSTFTPYFEKTDLPQRFALERRTVEWAAMSQLVQDENDPSPFPALTQIELWGNEVL